VRSQIGMLDISPREPLQDILILGELVKYITLYVPHWYELLNFRVDEVDLLG
jgi:hypothetical protein